MKQPIFARTCALHFARDSKHEIFWLWGVYRSQLVREAGAWLIRSHKLDVWATRRE